jgi:hypothetical protein
LYGSRGPQKWETEPDGKRQGVVPENKAQPWSGEDQNQNRDGMGDASK